VDGGRHAEHRLARGPAAAGKLDFDHLIRIAI